MSERPHIEPRFFETYHYADVITDLVEDWNAKDANLLLWHEYFCDEAVARLVTPFKPWSAFLDFVGFVIARLLDDYTSAVDLDERRADLRRFKGFPEIVASLGLYTLPVELALDARGFEYESFVSWLKRQHKSFKAAGAEDLSEYLLDLRMCGPFEDLVDQSTREVFFTLFANRTLLLQFNTIVALKVGELNPQESDEYWTRDAGPLFRRPGVLKRTRVPKWARRAVFFRERGRCVACCADLTGIMSLWTRENFDHIVPLDAGGLNDVTNIQLLCVNCNRRKGNGTAFTSGTYEDWYPVTDSRASGPAGIKKRSRRPSRRRTTLGGSQAGTAGKLKPKGGE